MLRARGNPCGMTVKGKAYIAGIFEHPTRLAPDKTVAQLHAEVALGALGDAGLTRDDVDGYFCSGDAPGPGPASMAEYMNLKLRHMDSTEIGGASYIALAAHAAEAIALGKCDVALVTLAGRPRSEGMATGTAPRQRDPNQPEAPWEAPYAITTVNGYAMCAMRHMYEYGTTTEQLAWVKVAASHHAQHNPHAMLPEVVTVEDILNSPLIADPLHRLDCCVISDGGGGIVLVRPEIAKKLKRPLREDHRCRRRLREASDRRHLRSHNLGRISRRSDRLCRSGRDAGNPSATARAIDADGVFRTGDLAHLADPGFIFEARIGDAMRLGGFLVSPEEIEAVIQAQLGVAGVQVVSASHRGGDPVPVAFVRPGAGAVLQEATLRSSCLQQLAGFKVPERIVVVDDFPIVESPNGAKVQKMRLREMAEALLCEERHQSSEICAG